MNRSSKPDSRDVAGCMAIVGLACIILSLFAMAVSPVLAGLLFVGGCVMLWMSSGVK